MLTERSSSACLFYGRFASPDGSGAERRAAVRLTRRRCFYLASVTVRGVDLASVHRPRNPSLKFWYRAVGPLVLEYNPTTGAGVLSGDDGDAA